MGNAVGEGRERERVGPQIHLALSVADRERRPFPRSNQQILLALEQVASAKAPRRRLSAACTACSGVLPAASSSSTTKAAISESVSVANTRPFTANSARSALKFSMR